MDTAEEEDPKNSKIIVGERIDFSGLEKAYENASSPLFMVKILYLKSISETLGMRKIRKDGSCFYRGFAFRFIEMMREEKRRLLREGRKLEGWYSKLLENTKNSIDILISQDYERDVIIDFFEPLWDLINGGEDDQDGRDLMEKFNVNHIAENIVCYLRILTAAVLKRDRELYEAFILDSFPNLEAFIQENVEPMSVESEQIHIVAMSNAFGLLIKIADVDISPVEGGIPLNFHEISPMTIELVEGAPPVELMYFPGHYEICYIKKD